LSLLFVLSALVGCGDEPTGSDADSGPQDAQAAADASIADAAIIDAVAIVIDASVPDASPFDPQTLAATGLYSSDEVLADGVQEYTLETELWTDGATKRRWVLLPPGTVIDTSDMDFWVYPVGTKLWKEFTRDGVRIETRLLWKQGPTANDWYAMAYLWNDQQTAAIAVPDGVEDAKGTAHDVPSEDSCLDCHASQPDVVLGFSAILLDHGLAGVSLDSLNAASLLSPPLTGSAPYFPEPGDSTAQDALRYLHVNCGGCHHEENTINGIQINLRLYFDRLATVEATPTYLSTVDVISLREIGGGFPLLIAPGDAAASSLHLHMNALDQDRMPPLGTEVVDSSGLASLDAWINSL
jgi:hypothetical protein